MDRRERSGSPSTALLAAFEGWQAGMWTALPAVVCAAPELPGALPFDPQRRTVTLQALVQVRVQHPTGDFEWVTIPPLVDVPVVFPGAGGVTVTFPVKKGDEGLVVFSSRCIDAWWQLGGKDAGADPTPQVQMEFRMHDLSDAFFVPGLNSLPHVIPAISTTAAQFRNDAGDTYVEVDPAGGFVNVVTPGDVGVAAGGSIAASAGADISATAGGNITIHSSGATTINADGGCTLNAPATTINSEVQINGHLQVRDGVKSPTYAGLTGGTGALTVHSAVIDTATVNGIVVDEHTHADPQGGNVGPMQ